MSQLAQTEFEKAASQQSDKGLVRELFTFLSQNKKWWLLPILLAVLVLGVLVMLSSSAAAPFIYPLF